MPQSTNSGFLSRVNGKLFTGRFSVFFATLVLYLIGSFMVRVAYFTWFHQIMEIQFFQVLKAFALGFCFDVSVGLGFLFLYAVYLCLFPSRWVGSFLDKFITYTYLIIILFIFFFSLLSEFPFWDEFGVRFNFIAVDYLVYTYEVLENINQSYPIPLIIIVILALILITLVIFKKKNFIYFTFTAKEKLTQRAIFSIPILAATGVLFNVLQNKQAEFSQNLSINEMSKNAVFSFFAAYRANELDYTTFYPTINNKAAYAIVKKNILQHNQHYLSNQWDDIERESSGNSNYRPNIIMVTIESFSADFLEYFGNKEQLTPFYDSLSKESIFFTNMYATGTRTVRGMEALTLCVPPTPGNSIVRRPNNNALFSIATVLRQKKYQNYFLYGGDGYFDNMDIFFSGQGFNIIDRNRNNPLSDKLATHRYNIPDNEVSFENAWGVCDEDIYRQSLKYADANFKEGQPFFQFIMTTSNHKPYTFPNHKIDLPQGNRNAAVKYTDFALGNYIAAAKTKPWFKNTVWIIVADHCASSAGKWEINIDKHHIPALFYNLPVAPLTINKLASQIDLVPSLFGYLNWNYNTNFYGVDLNNIKPGSERAFIGNYRTLGLLKNHIFTQLNDRKQITQYRYDNTVNTLTVLKTKDSSLVNETISYYQTASNRFKNGKMKE